MGLTVYFIHSFFVNSIANTLQDYAGNVALSLLQADSVKHFTKNVYVEVYQTRWEISQLPVLKWFFHKDENSTSSDPVISISIPFTRNATPPEDQPGKPIQIINMVTLVYINYI